MFCRPASSVGGPTSRECHLALEAEPTIEERYGALSTSNAFSRPRTSVRGIEDAIRPQIAQVVIDSTNPRASAEFWRSLLGLVYREGHEPPGLNEDVPAGQDWLNLLTPTGSSCLAFQKVEAQQKSTWPISGVPQQLHLDLTVRDLEELNVVHSRVLELGGELRLDRADSPEEPLFVYADPDGHPFCVFVSPH